MYATAKACCHDCENGGTCGKRSNGLSGILSIITFGLAGGKSVSESDARAAVNEMYLELLGRPLESGPSAYVECLTKGYCDFARDSQFWDGKGVKPESRVDAIRTHVMSSPEYRRRVETVITKSFEDVRAQSVSGGGSFSSGSMESFSMTGGGIPSDIGGIPLVYLIGGLAVVMLLKRR